MSSPSRAQVSFVLAGRALTLTPAKVQSCMRGIEPEPITSHAVRLDGRWYPVTQVFEEATGISRRVWTADRALGRLAALGLLLRTLTPWPDEDTVRWSLVDALEAEGWRIDRLVDAEPRTRAIDVVASLGGVTAAFEVKGFPTQPPDGVKPGEVARQWFADALLTAMKARRRHPEWWRVIVLPDVPRYRKLAAATADSFADAGIRVWWVDEHGAVAGERPPLEGISAAASPA